MVQGGGPGGGDQALGQLHAELRVQREVVVRSQEVQVNVFHLTTSGSVVEGGR